MNFPVWLCRVARLRLAVFKFLGHPRVVRLAELSGNVFQTSENEILPYSVVIGGLRKTHNGDDLFVIGSGTLVQISGRFGILTAAHVIDEERSPLFKKAQSISIGLKLEPHMFAIPKNHLNAMFLPAKSISRNGIIVPDIGFLEIPEQHLGWIKANKSFLNVDGQKDILSKNVRCADYGIWGVIGCPDEYTSEIHAIPNFPRARNVHVLAAFGTITKYTKLEGHDYYTFKVKNVSNEDAPKSYQGVSGGGLWQFDITGNTPETSRLINPRLKGVVFYQEPVKFWKRPLICHGHISIYEKMFELIGNSTSKINTNAMD